jgi:hypothetical protein
MKPIRTMRNCQQIADTTGTSLFTPVDWTM